MTLRKVLDPRKALIYTHRWLGIAGLLLFLVWFVSGIVFMYRGMPALSADERLMRMPALDLSALAVTPAEAAARAGLPPERVRIAMQGDRPIYRLQSGSDWRAVYADTGDLLQGVSRDDALAILRAWVPEHGSTIHYDRHLEDSDQWSLQSVIRSQMPLHRIALGDASGAHYYVSERTGEPVLRTDAAGRFWGYLGPVLHWLYFPPLRRHNEVWNAVVVWSSLIGAGMCLLGMVLGVWRLSIHRRFRLKGVPSRSPYAGMMRWHHYAGLAFGLFACTWAFSGALSLGPFQSLRASGASEALRNAPTGGPIDLQPLTVDRVRAAAATAASAFPIRELDFIQFRGEPYFIAYRPPAPGELGPWRNSGIAAHQALTLDREHVLVSALRPEAGAFMRFDNDAMLAVAEAAMPGVPIAHAAWLHEYDAYYYSQKGLRPLPVLHVRYADPRETWLYLDPQRGSIASRSEWNSRWNRWLYNGLHSLDFPFLYYRRPIWDIVVIGLSLGGVALTVTTLLPAWRRLQRQGHAIGGRLHRRQPAPVGRTEPVAALQSRRLRQEAVGADPP